MMLDTSIFNGDKLFEFGKSIAAFIAGIAGVFAGYQSWRGRQHSEKSEAVATETKEITQAAGQEIHETKVVAETTKQAVNSSDFEGLKKLLETQMQEVESLKKMLELHMASNDARMLSYRSLLDEYTVRLARFEKEGDSRAALLQNINVRLTAIEVSIGKLEGLIEKLDHSSNRHSEQINILLNHMLAQRNGGTVPP